MNDLAYVDHFCPTRSDDPYWNESAWFSFSIPERKIHGSIYYFFRPNMNLLVGGPYMWDPSGAFPWNCLYYDWQHIQAIAPGSEKFNFTAPNSLSVQILEPLKRYRITYDKNGFQMDLEWTAITEPHPFGMEAAARGKTSNDLPPESRMHIEQAGHVRGVVRSGGETYDIDCYSLRDTSYGVRQISGPHVHHNGYFWGVASPERSFHAMTFGDLKEQKVIGGFLVRDGEMSSLVSGTRKVVEMGPYTPAVFRIEATDELGRKLDATCKSHSDFLFRGYPDVAITWSMLEVDFGDQIGWGDLQEAGPREEFRERQRQGR